MNGVENGQDIKPPKGTQLDDRLEEELFQYCINGPQAQQRSQIHTSDPVLQKKDFITLDLILLLNT